MKKDIHNKGLKDILAPISESTFFENYYEQKVCLIKRQNKDYFKGLLNMNHIDEYMTNRTIQYPKIRMVNYTEDVKSDAYTNPNGAINVGNATKLFQEGATLVFSALHEQLENMKYLVDMVSKDYWQKLQTNIYLTPPHSQGFQAHYDTHDVFVLQTSGKKKWYIFENNERELPLKSQAFEVETYEPGKVVQEFILEAGDTLYIPRGVFHCAETLEDTSLHITMGLLAYTWSDLLVENIIHLSKEQVQLRQNVPFHLDSILNQEKIEKLLNLIKAETYFQANEKRFKNNLIQNQQPTLAGLLIQSAEINLINVDTILQTRQNILFLIRKSDKEIEITLLGNKVIFPLFTNDLVEFVISTKNSFALNDLPDVCDDNGKIAFAKRLIKEGLLQITNDKKSKKNEKSNLFINHYEPALLDN
jgi:ribosomal protein L16 Arg81 hydroxylase